MLHGLDAITSGHISSQIQTSQQQNSCFGFDLNMATVLRFGNITRYNMKRNLKLQQEKNQKADKH